MSVIPVTIKIFGISASFLLPGGRLWSFAIGAIFWITVGPIIRWAIKNSIG